jgi:hypothetical protein
MFLDKGVRERFMLIVALICPVLKYTICLGEVQTPQGHKPKSPGCIAGTFYYLQIQNRKSDLRFQNLFAQLFCHGSANFGR